MEDESPNPLTWATFSWKPLQARGIENIGTIYIYTPNIRYNHKYMSSILAPVLLASASPKNWKITQPWKKIPRILQNNPGPSAPFKNLQKSKGSGATESTSSIEPFKLEPSDHGRTARNSPCFFDLFRCEWLNDLKLTWKYDLYWNCIDCGVTVDHPLAPKGVVEVDNQRKIAHRLVLTMSIDRLHTLKSIFSAWNK